MMTSIPFWVDIIFWLMQDNHSYTVTDTYINEKLYLLQEECTRVARGMHTGQHIYCLIQVTYKDIFILSVSTSVKLNRNSFILSLVLKRLLATEANYVDLIAV